MRYVDTHCHLDQYRDPLSVLRHAETAGVVTIAVTDLPSHYQRLSMRMGRRKPVRVAIGMHPLRVPSASPMELALFAELLDDADYVGEVGLDGSQAGKDTLRKQRKVFEHLLQQRRIEHKILTVHSRGAEADTIKVLADAGVTAILHWYTGPLKHIDAALAAGLWFSVNPSMLRSQNGQRIIAALPRNRVLTETDGPYSKLGGRASDPRDIPTVVRGLGRIWGEDEEQARARIFGNMASVAAAAGVSRSRVD